MREKNSFTKSRNTNLKLVKTDRKKNKKNSGKSTKKKSGKAVNKYSKYERAYEQKESFRFRKMHFIIIATALSIAAICAVTAFLVTKFTVSEVIVEGNFHYTDEEIRDIVMEGRLGDNSLYLSFKYKNKSITDIPFIQTMDVKVLSANSIKITVYEKSLAGYVEYLGKYMYFDRDGIVVESSDQRTMGIPQVTGLKFDHIVLYDVLPIDNANVFKEILTVTQLISKYGLSADRIYFDSTYDMVIYFGNVKVDIGTDENLDEKLMQLQHILPKLEGRSGTLRLSNYEEGANSITFDEDKTTDAGMQ